VLLRTRQPSPFSESCFHDWGRPVTPALEGADHERAQRVRAARGVRRDAGSCFRNGLAVAELLAGRAALQAAHAPRLVLAAAGFRSGAGALLPRPQVDMGGVAAWR
jgi:hypothetical protein